MEQWKEWFKMFKMMWQCPLVDQKMEASAQF